MNIIIKATGIELTDPIRDYVQKRISSIEKFIIQKEVPVYVEIGKTTDHHKSGDIFRAEVSLEYKGSKIYTVVERDDLYSAIDGVEDSLYREITTNQDRSRALWKRGAQQVKNMMKGITDFPSKFRK